MKTVVLHEGPLRGFLSNYITLLTAYKKFVGEEGYHYNNILLAPDNFIMYGEAKNWFDINTTHNWNSDAIHCNTDVICEITDYPTPNQLNLLSYQQFVPYNNKVNSYLATNMKQIDKCLGIHYRGTDHHIARIDMQKLYEKIKEQLDTDNFEQIFICSDEIGKVEEIQEYVSKTYKFDNFVTNDNIKSSGRTAVFFINFDVETKIKLGYEVLLDSHMLSKCDFVLCKASNIINYSRILNLKLNGFYLDSNRYFFEG